MILVLVFAAKTTYVSSLDEPMLAVQRNYSSFCAVGVVEGILAGFPHTISVLLNASI